ncbi:TRAP transporter substrate-binding protein [Pseudogracilibacillus auburnensis]|uniref:Tripartite ATP-independent transporter DctP family solute receptor n=1 Tax=Pseudogracilibacillus auburnensis TaxID=1494959 RepID=A0A2V3VTJ2_9BACI|nr:TRAP transporter substrate-binding protein [Pseudogracilibacillus auburnensis]PXW83325.1 tripartite ATP-independent transporter DctP family solute receptor [Pseudogracilibacillus auburnensis]
MNFVFLRRSILFVLLFSFVLTACSNNGNEKGDHTSKDGNYDWSVGFNTVEDSIRGVAAQEFKRIIEEESDGKISVELFPNEQLGSDNEMIESVQVGALDFQLSSSGALAEIMPEYSATDLPFMFEDADEAHAALDGVYGDVLKEVSSAEGINMLNTFSIGFSQITTNAKPIDGPEDLTGASIRSPNEPVPIATFEKLGSQVTTLPFTEVYLGLQQGTIDGQFNPLTAIKDSNFHEVQDYLAMTDIIFYHAPFIMNQELWDSLDADTQELVQRAADKATEAAREFEAETEAEVLAEIEGDFEEVTYPDKELFQEAVQPVYEQFEEEIGRDIIDELQSFLEEYRN